MAALILLLDGTDRRGGRKHAVDLVFLDEPKELARVRRSDRLALVDDGGVAVEKGRVANGLVANNPPVQKIVFLEHYNATGLD